MDVRKTQVFLLDGCSECTDRLGRNMGKSIGLTVVGIMDGPDVGLSFEMMHPAMLSYLNLKNKSDTFLLPQDILWSNMHQTYVEMKTSNQRK